MRLVFWVFAFVACSNGPSDVPLTAAEKRALVDKACPIAKHPYLYRVEKDGRTSYLFGTRHISVGLGKFSARVNDLIAEQREFVFETPRESADKGKLPDHLPGARDALGPDSWRKYRELVGTAIADKVADKPVMVAALLLVLQFEDVTHQLEKEIWEVGQRHNSEADALETDAFQLELLARVMDVRLTKAVIADIPDRDRLRSEMVKELSDYCAGTDRPPFDDTTLRDLKTAGFTKSEVDAYEDAMVFARNRDWIPKLEKIFARSNVFVAVGAGHLRGDRGVPALLRAEGYTVTRVDD